MVSAIRLACPSSALSVNFVMWSNTIKSHSSTTIISLILLEIRFQSFSPDISLIIIELRFSNSSKALSLSSSENWISGMSNRVSAKYPARLVTVSSGVSSKKTIPAFLPFRIKSIIIDFIKDVLPLPVGAVHTASSGLPIPYVNLVNVSQG